jgi:hypothetical protein
MTTAGAGVSITAGGGGGGAYVGLGLFAADLFLKVDVRIWIYEAI